MPDLVTLVIGAGGVLATVIVAVFYQSILARIGEKRDMLNPELDKAIETEAKKYLKEKPIKKRDILSRLSTLDYFRIQLGRAEDTTNKGVLLMSVGVILLFAVTAFAQNITLSTLINSYATITVVNSTTHQVSINQIVPPSQIIFWLGLYVALFFFVFAVSNFNTIWNIGKVISRRYGERDEDITAVVCMFFQSKRGFFRRTTD